MGSKMKGKEGIIWERRERWCGGEGAGGPRAERRWRKEKGERWEWERFDR